MQALEVTTFSLSPGLTLADFLVALWSLPGADCRAKGKRRSKLLS